MMKRSNLTDDLTNEMHRKYRLTPYPGDALELTVSAHDFVTDGAPDTRATDKGKTTTFENGDCVGIIILDKGNSLIYNNMPYKHVSSSHAWIAADTEKGACYYDPQAHTYIVYYPYSAKADDCKSESDLKAIFKPQTDQSDKEAYRASDLMVNTIISDVPLKSLTASLTHAYASVSLSPIAQYILDDGAEPKNTCTSPSLKISDVNFTIGDAFYVPYQATDGSLRCILPAEFTTGNIRCFYTVGSKTYGNEINIATVDANTRYTSAPEIISGEYTLDDAKVGDFYCKRSDGNGYLIPGDVTLIEGQKNACVGIVFWVGDEALQQDPLLGEKYPGCTHGLVVALQDATLNGDTNMNWSKHHQYVQNWVNDNNTYKNVVNIQEISKMCGYSNTLALMAFNTEKGANDGLRVLPCDAILQYSEANHAPENSSGWYFPSVMELKYVCWGQGKGQSITGCYNLNTQIGVSGGSPFDSGNYWSSTEYSEYTNSACGVNFGSGSVNYIGAKNGNAFRVRPLLAF